MKVYSDMKGAYILLRGKNLNGWEQGDEFLVLTKDDKIILEKKEGGLNDKNNN